MELLECWIPSWMAWRQKLNLIMPFSWRITDRIHGDTVRVVLRDAVLLKGLFLKSSDRLYLAFAGSLLIFIHAFLLLSVQLWNRNSFRHKKSIVFVHKIVIFITILFIAIQKLSHDTKDKLPRVTLASLRQQKTLLCKKTVTALNLNNTCIRH